MVLSVCISCKIMKNDFYWNFLFGTIDFGNVENCFLAATSNFDGIDTLTWVLTWTVFFSLKCQTVISYEIDVNTRKDNLKIMVPFHFRRLFSLFDKFSFFSN